jgi:hypothetical protein
MTIEDRGSRIANRRRTVAFLAAAAILVVISQRAVADGGAWGSVKGRVVWAGDKLPMPEEITPNANQNPQQCLAKGKLYKEDLVVNPKNKGVRWVIVWLQPVPGGPPLTIKPELKELKEKQVVVDQPTCAFEPRVLCMRQGQELIAKNSAPMVHNVNWTGHPLHNPGGNRIVPPGGSLPIKDLKADRFPVTLACNIHPWMRGYVRIFDHPYFAVTDENGAFEIKDAPAGNLSLASWQETVGYLTGRNGTPVVIKGGAETDVGTIEMKPAGGQ